MDNQNYSEQKIESRFNANDYQLIEKVGEGGFGQVYKALQLNTQQFVAIKLLTLNPEYDIEKRRRYIERFERETLLGSHLQHPNIVRLLDKGQCDSGLIYAVFEYIEGQSLKERLMGSGALMPLDAAEIMAQVLDALAHAHKQGVIHRDIKPANIMLTKMGAKTHAKILDFGIGTLVHEVRQLDFKSITLTQESLGTPSYSAPEQLRGEPPTPKTDLYVWGLVFIECLTGRPAISGSNLASIFHKQLNSSNVPLPAAIAGHPVAELLRRVLHKKTSERAVSATEVYKEFIKLNLSTLVGDLTSSPAKLELTNSTVSMDAYDDRTLINDSSTLYTSLTERKQITVLCLSINVKSVTQEKIDLEVIDALHRDQKSHSIDIAIRYGAFHVGTLGDTLLFYFGYPNVSDNDPRLCARTALEIISSLNKSNSLRKDSQGILAEAHIGLHTGIITTYEDTIPEGDTPNIAMELTRIALANQILCSDASRKVLESYIEFEPSEVRAMGVNNKDTPLYLLTGERQVEAFGFLRANRQHHGFIGRENELAELAELLDIENSRGKGTGKNKFAHVFGEAGIGKSRLVFELRNQVQVVNHYVAQCLPEYKHSALFPVLNVIKYKYSLDTLSKSSGVELLREIVRSIEKVDETQGVPLLCAWLDLPLPDDLVSVQQAPEIQKKILFDVISDLLLYQNEDELSRNNLYIFEDLHWADPSSIEFIAYFVSLSTFHEAQHVFISTSRQALPVMLQSIASVSIEVPKLSKDKMTNFIETMFENQKMEQNVLDIVIKRTDGIPLFIEELVNMLKHKGLVHRLNGIISFTSPEKLNEVPSSLRDSLQQKLDDLTYAKDLAQLASAIGREFDYKLLAASSNLNEEQLQLSINELLSAELIYIQRKVDSDIYIFKHALVRDAAYESMLPSYTKQIHLQIAETLENFSESTRDQNPSILAMHWGAADKFDRAVDYGIHAAGNALQRSIAKDAIYEGRRVESWIEQLESGEQHDPKQEIYKILTSAYMESDGWASEKVLEYADKSKKLLQTSEHVDDLIPALWWEILNGVVGGSNEGLAEACAGLRSLRGKVSDINKSAIDCALGFNAFAQGKNNSCLETISLLEASIASYAKNAIEDNSHQQVFGFDIKVFSSSLLGRAYGFADDRKRAEQCVTGALEYARITENVPSVGIALMYCAELFQQYQDRERVRFYSGELMSLANKYDQPIYESYGQMLFDWAEDDFQFEKSSYDSLFLESSMFSLGQYQSYYAETRARAGDYAEAINKINFCIKLDQSAGHGFFLPHLCYLKANYMLQLGEDENEINLLLESASRLAEKQQSWFFIEEIKKLKTESALVL